MKYLKLVNIPWKYFKEDRYGTHTRGGPIRWISMGFNAQIIQRLKVQFEDANGDHIDYLPIADESKVQNILPLIAADMAETVRLSQEANDGAVYSWEIVEDDREAWLAEADADRAKKDQAAADKAAARRLAEEQAYERMKAEQS
jgi:hypothetical protein